MRRRYHQVVYDGSYAVYRSALGCRQCPRRVIPYFAIKGGDPAGHGHGDRLAVERTFRGNFRPDVAANLLVVSRRWYGPRCLLGGGGRLI